ncbi:MAG: deoxyribonuclease IV [Polyangia bacterium]
MLIGAHQSIRGGIHRAVERASDDGCKCLQVFTKAPQAWREPRVEAEEVERLREARERTGIGPLISHASYLVNTCSATRRTRARSLEALKNEAARCDLLGIELLVFHAGSPGELGESEGIRLVAEAVAETVDASERVELLVENTAGQGRSIGHRLEQLAAILEACDRPDRTGICLDTCHGFAAGYQVGGESENDLLEEVDRAIGIDRVGAMHLNDSRGAQGSRVDRHERIGRGLIGLEAFERLVNDPRLEGMPAVLETPIEKGETYREEVETLTSLRGYRSRK